MRRFRISRGYRLTTLLLKSLESMQELGYAYAIIGWPAKSAVDFYKKCVDAIMIDEKSSGVYKRMIEIDE